MNIMKQFLRPKPIEIQIQNLSGENITLTMEEFTSEKTAIESQIIHNIITNQNKEGFDVFDCLRDKLVNYFGHDNEFYKQFDQRLISQVIGFMNEQIKNPT
jgi:hypothetical protein